MNSCDTCKKRPASHTTLTKHWCDTCWNSADDSDAQLRLDELKFMPTTRKRGDDTAPMFTFADNRTLQDFANTWKWHCPFCMGEHSPLMHITSDGIVIANCVCIACDVCAKASVPAASYSYDLLASAKATWRVAMLIHVWSKR